MPDKIDYKFLSDLEGGSKTQGYLPAAGFDLGQRKYTEVWIK